MTEPPTPMPHPPRDFGETLRRVAPDLELVDRAMREQLGSVSALVPRMGEHVLGSGGKRMRPALLLLAAEMCGYEGPRAIQISAAIELLHTATLLHDDVVDLSRLRRGRPSANAVWGNRRAVLAGDFFYARASSMIVEDGNVDILWIFANAIRRMSEGELLQLERSYDPDITEALYYSVIEHKSAVLLATATESGAILGGVTRGEQRKLANFGRELGIAFQLRDDLLGATGVALTDLRPSGTAQVGDERLDVVSDVGFVAKGRPVRVIRSDGYRHVVEPIDQQASV